MTPSREPKSRWPQNRIAPSLDLRAILFDVNGTLIRIRTQEDMQEVFRAAAHFLTYQGVDLHRDQVRHLYFSLLKDQLHNSPERFPEYDAVAIWQSIVESHATRFTAALPVEKRQQLPVFLAEVTRGISRRRLRLYPHARAVLDILRRQFPLAVVSDAQSAYARGELHKVGLLNYFHPIVISGDHGFRKPDPRLFQIALDELGVQAKHALFVGDNIYRDVFGAREVGMTTVLFDPHGRPQAYPDCVPDHLITDLRALLAIVDPSRWPTREAAGHRNPGSPVDRATRGAEPRR